jgi:hypothetical protein
MRLFLLNRNKPQHGFEVVKYDPDRHRAILRGTDGSFTLDRHFHIDEVKRFYKISQTEPEWLKESGHAVVT